jgi:hypothetical protein
VTVPKTLQYVLTCYRALLWLYPRDFRVTYGYDMADVFQQQLCAEWTRRGMRGVLATGSYAIGEIFTIALPGQLLNERMIAPCLSLPITSAIFMTLLAFMRDNALAKWISHKFLFGGCR